MFKKAIQVREAIEVDHTTTQQAEIDASAKEAEKKIEHVEPEHVAPSENADAEGIVILFCLRDPS